MMLLQWSTAPAIYVILFGLLMLILNRIWGEEDPAGTQWWLVLFIIIFALLSEMVAFDSLTPEVPWVEQAIISSGISFFILLGVFTAHLSFRRERQSFSRELGGLQLIYAFFVDGTYFNK